MRVAVEPVPPKRIRQEKPNAGVKFPRCYLEILVRVYQEPFRCSVQLSVVRQTADCNQQRAGHKAAVKGLWQCILPELWTQGFLQNYDFGGVCINTSLCGGKAGVRYVVKPSLKVWCLGLHRKGLTISDTRTTLLFCAVFTAWSWLQLLSYTNVVTKPEGKLANTQKTID